MDLTTRRDVLEGRVTDMIGSAMVDQQMCRDNHFKGTENNCGMSSGGGELPVGKNTNSFSIRNLVGTVDSDQTTDETSSEGKSK